MKEKHFMQKKSFTNWSATDLYRYDFVMETMDTFFH